VWWGWGDRDVAVAGGARVCAGSHSACPRRRSINARRRMRALPANRILWPFRRLRDTRYHAGDPRSDQPRSASVRAPGGGASDWNANTSRSWRAEAGAGVDFVRGSDADDLGTVAVCLLRTDCAASTRFMVFIGGLSRKAPPPSLASESSRDGRRAPARSEEFFQTRRP